MQTLHEPAAGGALRAGLDHLACSRACARAASQRILRRLVTATGLSRRANERASRHRRPDRSIHHTRAAALTTRPGDLSPTPPPPALLPTDIPLTRPISPTPLPATLPP